MSISLEVVSEIISSFGFEATELLAYLPILAELPLTKQNEIIKKYQQSQTRSISNLKNNIKIGLVELKSLAPTDDLQQNNHNSSPSPKKPTTYHNNNSMYNQNDNNSHIIPRKLIVPSGHASKESVIAENTVTITKFVYRVFETRPGESYDFTDMSQNTYKCNLEVKKEDLVANRIIRMVGDPSRFAVLSISLPSKSKFIWKLYPFQNRLKKRLLEPFHCEQNGKTYKFLGWSPSGLRGCKIWLFNESSMTVQEFRKLLGDFTPVLQANGIGKYCARIGQAFADSIHITDVPSDKIIFVKDEKSTKPDGSESIHTDGCGMIDFRFAQEVATKLGLNYVPSVFQFRLGGCKGVVATYDISRVVGNANVWLVFRPSMKKYDSQLRQFEILNYSGPSYAGCLNKQLIIQLYEMGVPQEVFEKHIEERIKLLHDMLDPRNVDAALKVLETTDHEFDEYADNALKMILAGHSTTEPMLRSYLRGIQKKKLEDLSKSLKMPLLKSRNLIGVADECGVLEEGEVAICISSTDLGAINIQGDVLVTRYPCYYPGDIRLLKAVIRPQLSHLMDCVVFSVKGQRSVTDMMSGGDLDGDRFFVCWDQEFLPPKTFDPLDYSGGPKKVPPPIGNDLEQEMINFFIDFHAHDCVGKLNKLQEAIAGTDGPAHPNAAEVAKLIGKALVRRDTLVVSHKQDTAKNGIEKNIYPKHLDYYTKMNAQQANSIVEILKRKILTTNDEPNQSITVDLDLNLRHKNPVLFDKWKQQGLEWMKEYNKNLSKIIEERERDKEEQKHKREPRRIIRAAKKQYNAEDEVEKKITEAFCADVKPDQEDLAYVKASAWYCAAYEQERKKFPWLFADLLNRIKADACAKRDGRGVAFTIARHVYPMIHFRLSSKYAMNPLPAVQPTNQQVPQEASSIDVKSSAMETTVTDSQVYLDVDTSFMDSQPPQIPIVPSQPTQSQDTPMYDFISDNNNSNDLWAFEDDMDAITQCDLFTSFEGLRSIEIHTDGSSLGNPGPSGWAFIIRFVFADRDEKFSTSNGVANATGNQMEMLAAIKALRKLKKRFLDDPFRIVSPCPINVYVDSQYLQQGMTSWIHNWKKAGWTKKDGTPVLNPEYWKTLDELSQQLREKNFSLSWKKVKGHAGDPLNEEVDRMAFQEAKKMQNGK